jgi:FeS assembly protein IscX
MLMPASFGWLDVDRIAEELADAHPALDPFSVKFTDLRRMVESMPGFSADPKHPVNEKILETIQSKWHEEIEDLAGDDDE